LKTLILNMYEAIIRESKGNFIPYVKDHFPSIEKPFIKQFFILLDEGKV